MEKLWKLRDLFFYMKNESCQLRLHLKKYWDTQSLDRSYVSENRGKGRGVLVSTINS